MCRALLRLALARNLHKSTEGTPRRNPNRRKLHETLVGVEPPFRAGTAAAAKFFRRNRMSLVEGRGVGGCSSLPAAAASAHDAGHARGGRDPRSLNKCVCVAKIFSTGLCALWAVAVGKLKRPTLLYPRPRRADGWGDRVHETDSERKRTLLQEANSLAEFT
nr:unnamed protein product [Digitaria exilis]